MAKRMISGKFPTMQILGVVGGAFVAGIVNNVITKNMPDAKETTKSIVPLGLGIFLAMQKNEILKGAGLGMVATGGAALVKALMPAPEVTGVDDYFMNEYDDYLNAPADQSILSMPADQSILSGYDDDVMNGEEEFMNAYDGGSYED